MWVLTSIQHITATLSPSTTGALGKGHLLLNREWWRQFSFPEGPNCIEHHFRLRGSSCCSGEHTGLGKGRRRQRAEESHQNSQHPAKAGGPPACARGHEEPGGNMAVVRGWTEPSPAGKPGSFTDGVLSPLPALPEGVGATECICNEALGEERAIGMLYLVPKPTFKRQHPTCF